MTRWTASRLLLTLLATACALALVGCGEGPSAAQQRLAGAAAATTDAGSARITISTAPVGDDAQDSRARTTGEGEIDFAADRGRIAAFLPGRKGAGTERVETIFLDGVVYSQMTMPEGVQWLRVNTAEVGAFEQPGSPLDPRAQLALLGAAHDAEVLGAEQVRGEDTTHHRFLVDLEAAGDAADTVQRQAIDALRLEIGSDELAMEAWLDAADRVRRLRHTVAIAPVEGHGAITGRHVLDAPGTTITVEYHDFGVPVVVIPPPQEQIVELHDLDPELWGPLEAGGPPTARVIPDEDSRAIDPPSAHRAPDGVRIEV